MLVRTVMYSPLQNCTDANYPIILYYLAYEGAKLQEYSQTLGYKRAIFCLL